MPGLGTLPLKEDPKTTTTRQVVQSATSRQPVAGGRWPVAGVSVRRGDEVTVRVLSGERTGDYRTWPMTGPSGYDAATDKLMERAKDCKVKPTAPLRALLARLVGEQDFPVHSVGQKPTFQAAGNGTLQLGASDVAGLCSQDNRGSMTVQVTVTHQP
ncbi:hypothetical protein [Streptomyces sp. NPDC050263]|uniref:hypothetical protein n=1 Tax=Streptomyces sp. NPDC050263 TaxID=3155037 RepID=UPI0034265C77